MVKQQGSWCCRRSQGWSVGNQEECRSSALKGPQDLEHFSMTTTRSKLSGGYTLRGSWGTNWKNTSRPPRPRPWPCLQTTPSACRPHRLWAAGRDIPLPVTSLCWGTSGTGAIPWPRLHVSFQIQGLALRLAHLTLWQQLRTLSCLFWVSGGRPPCPVRWTLWTPHLLQPFEPHEGLSSKSRGPDWTCLFPALGLSTESGAATPAVRLSSPQPSRLRLPTAPQVCTSSTSLRLLWAPGPWNKFTGRVICHQGQRRLWAVCPFPSDVRVGAMTSPRKTGAHVSAGSSPRKPFSSWHPSLWGLGFAKRNVYQPLLRLEAALSLFTDRHGHPHLALIRTSQPQPTASLCLDLLLPPSCPGLPAPIHPVTGSVSVSPGRGAEVGGVCCHHWWERLPFEGSLWPELEMWEMTAPWAVGQHPSWLSCLLLLTASRSGGYSPTINISPRGGEV